MAIVLIILAGLLVGGAISAQRQGSSRNLVVLMYIAAVLSALYGINQLRS